VVPLAAAIFLAALATRQQSVTVRFPSAAEMLEPFGLGQGGAQYRRLLAAFERIFGATIFFGTDSQVDAAAVLQQARFNFMSEARLWYCRSGDQQALREVGENIVVLSPEFYRDITMHPIPTSAQRPRNPVPALGDYGANKPAVQATKGGLPNKARCPFSAAAHRRALKRIAVPRSAPSPQLLTPRGEPLRRIAPSD